MCFTAMSPGRRKEGMRTVNRPSEHSPDCRFTRDARTALHIHAKERNGRTRIVGDGRGWSGGKGGGAMGEAAVAQ